MQVQELRELAFKYGDPSHIDIIDQAEGNIDAAYTKH